MDEKRFPRIDPADARTRLMKEYNPLLTVYPLFGVRPFWLKQYNVIGPVTWADVTLLSYKAQSDFFLAGMCCEAVYTADNFRVSGYLYMNGSAFQPFGSACLCMPIGNGPTELFPFNYHMKKGDFFELRGTAFNHGSDAINFVSYIRGWIL